MMITGKARAQPRRPAAARSRGRADGAGDRPSAEAIRATEPKQARAHATRERLLDAFADLLDKRPYGEISVADIAAAADLTTGAVYARFGDKHGVAIALTERFLSQSFELMDSWAAQDRWTSATPAEIIDNWTRGAINYGRMYRPYLMLMLDDRSLRGQHTAIIDHSSRSLARLLRNAMNEPVDEHFDGDVEFAARAILERFELEDDAESHARISRLIRRITGVSE
jgi:AcrR family transcriptional regulator